MRYLRADFLPYNDWGECTYFLEFDGEDHPQRQIEMYENGTVLMYDLDYPQDDFGALANSTIHAFLEQANIVKITADQFEELWTTVTPTNL